jgi:hypothetical protein
MKKNGKQSLSELGLELSEAKGIFHLQRFVRWSGVTILVYPATSRDGLWGVGSWYLLAGIYG